MENLGIDYKLLIAQIINFCLFFVVFSRFIAKPFMKYMEGEKHKDTERERILLELQTKHERMEHEEKEWRKQVKKEQEKILAETKKIASTMKEELLNEAKEEANVIVVRAKSQMEEEKAKFQKEMKTYVSDVSIFVIERALRTHLTEDVQKKLTEHVIENLKKDVAVYEN